MSGRETPNVEVVDLGGAGNLFERTPKVVEVDVARDPPPSTHPRPRESNRTSSPGSGPQ
jgi:hypothetical protein